MAAAATAIASLLALSTPATPAELVGVSTTGDGDALLGPEGCWELPWGWLCCALAAAARFSCSNNAEWVCEAEYTAGTGRAISIVVRGNIDATQGCQDSPPALFIVPQQLLYTFAVWLLRVETRSACMYPEPSVMCVKARQQKAICQCRFFLQLF